MLFDNSYHDAAMVFLVAMHLFLILYRRRGLTFYLARLLDILEAFQRSLLFAFLPLARRWWRQILIELGNVKAKIAGPEVG